ncbi:hypothetical protein PILCRDRAFT_687902 [Piloderma croceum F 1598]|uniref:Uncharacterized protein n=1 Tax=Piloderma croceum (strain F 1598) TaxID=765440 RepID=A0A0C3AMF9_PILCF|nr:hypothetical protein PILCRDRAFT_687902 [Piloderma croceum F 1598]
MVRTQPIYIYFISYTNLMSPIQLPGGKLADRWKGPPTQAGYDAAIQPQELTRQDNVPSVRRVRQSPTPLPLLFQQRSARSSTVSSPCAGTTPSPTQAPGQQTNPKPRMSPSCKGGAVAREPQEAGAVRRVAREGASR